MILNDIPMKEKDDIIKKKWFDQGGVLFTSDHTLRRFLKPLLEDKDKLPSRYAAFFSPGPDVVVVDEAHLFLKNNQTGISKVLSMIDTKRRIALTGTPLQNNLMEYYRMANWIKPDCLGPTNRIPLVDIQNITF